MNDGGASGDISTQRFDRHTGQLLSQNLLIGYCSGYAKKEDLPGGHRGDINR